jgi:hypothetical protein
VRRTAIASKEEVSKQRIRRRSTRVIERGAERGGSGSSEASGWNLGGLIGCSPAEVADRLGPPTMERRVGGDVWLRFAAEGVSLRVRCEAEAGGGEPTVASWTATFEAGRASLRAAAEALGLWPDVAPDCEARGRGPLIRRPLEDPAGGCRHSMTAAVRRGVIVQVTVFDEEPDWL